MKRKVDINLAEQSTDFSDTEVAWWDESEVFIHQTEKDGKRSSVVFVRSEAVEVRDTLDKFLRAGG